MHAKGSNKDILTLKIIYKSLKNRLIFLIFADCIGQFFYTGYYGLHTLNKCVQYQSGQPEEGFHKENDNGQ